MSSWRVDRPYWKGQAAFIVGGGPSVLTQDLTLLEGRNVIAINTSYEIVPFAQYLVFADTRWFLHHRAALRAFKGRIISCSRAASGPPLLLTMLRTSTPGLASDPGTLMVRNTTLTAAINLAVHLGANPIVLLGIDQKPDASGRIHHHAPHPWKPSSDCWQRQQSDLPAIAADLKARGIECVNASPGSALDLWPVVRLEDYVEAAAPMRWTA